MPSQPPKAPDNEHLDDELLALLYGELGDAEESAALARTATSPAREGELHRLRALRELLAELPDEDPPAVISNKLLALAAQEGPAAQRRARGFFAWLADLAAPMARHPAVAALASLVLVAGVAGTLYVTGKARDGHPTARSEAPPDRAASAALEQGPRATTPAPTTGAKPPAPEALADEAPLAAGDDLDGESSKPLTKPRPASGRAAAANTSSKDTGRPLKGIFADDIRPAEDANLSVGGMRTADTTRATAGKASSEVSPAQSVKQDADRRVRDESYLREDAKGAPVANAEVAPEPASYDDQKEQEKAEQKPASAPPPRAPDLHKQALSAAKKGACDTVLDLGRRIQRLDATYYAATFARDARLASCLPRRDSESKTKNKAQRAAPADKSPKTKE